MKIEAIEQLSIEKPPPLGKYHEAIRILLDGGIGTKVRVTEESKFHATKARHSIHHHLYKRDISIRVRGRDNVLEIERIS